MRSHAGFTLIELMIVIAILGILLAIAIPAYSDYTVRARVSEGLSLASSSKTQVSESRLSSGTFPATNLQAGMATAIASTYVTGLAVSAGGVLTITYDTAIDRLPELVGGNTIQLTPTFATSTVQWGCVTGSTIASRFVPARCRP